MPGTGLVENDRGGLPPIETDLPFGGGGGGDDSNPERGSSRSLSVAGLIVGMVASTMTFLALACTLILRHALGTKDWISLPVPAILWPNTAVLILSSLAIELARHALRNKRRELFNWLWWLGIALGGGFLAGQTTAWEQLVRQGVYMNTNPSHGLFYILTWTHAAHAIGGMIALIWFGIAGLRLQLGPRKRTGILVSSIFWHFLVVMWLCLMGLFIFWG